MATYYVDYVNGSDANNGLGPDASAVTNKPWKTITKLLGAAGMVSGDTAYLSPAGPFRETVSIAMTSPVAETKIIGDHANARGFKTSGGALVASGPIIVTAYTTNDKTAPSSSAVLNLNGKSFLTFQNIFFVGGPNTVIAANTATSTNINFYDCAIIPSSGRSSITATCAFNTPFNWVIDRCFIFGHGNGSVTISLILATGVGADYDVNFIVQNSYMWGYGGFQILGSGASANKGGGVKFRNSFYYGLATFFNAGGGSGGTSTTIPCVVSNSLMFIVGGSACLSASVSGQITEDYNIIQASTARSNVTAGTHSIADFSYAPLFHFGQERIWGGLLRLFGEPMANSPHLAFGNDGSQTSYDNRNNPRPAGGTSASPGIGPLERSNTFARETSTVHTGSNAISTTGPAYQDFLVPVDVASTTLGLYVRWDATYAGTKPQIQVLSGEECGVSTATATAVGSSDTWEQLTLNFTPTSKGIITLRVISNDTNGGGKCFADSFSVA